MDEMVPAEPVWFSKARGPRAWVHFRKSACAGICNNSGPFSRAILFVKSCSMILLISEAGCHSGEIMMRRETNMFCSTASWEGSRVYYQSQKELRANQLPVKTQPSG